MKLMSDQMLNFRGVAVDSKDGDYTRKILEHAIHKIYNDNDSGLSFLDIYRNDYHTILHKYGDKVYSELEFTLTLQVQEMAKAIEAAQGPYSFLEELKKKWTNHGKALLVISDIFSIFVPSCNKTALHELGLNIWRENVIHSAAIQSRLIDALLTLVSRERRGEVICKGLMRDTIGMLMNLGLYQNDFEKPFLDVSTSFYKAESQEFLELYNCGAYLKKAETRRNEEIERVSLYLNTKTADKITCVVETEMIVTHMHRLLQMDDSGLTNMLAKDKYEDLRRMYNLFCLVPDGLESMRELMTSHLKDIGKQLVTDPEKVRDPVELVQCLLNDMDKYDRIINSAFCSDGTFQIVLTTSFEYCLNLNPGSPEFISLFVDEKLLKGYNEDFEIIIDKVMRLLSFLKEKDVFEEYYKKHMVKRFLSGKPILYNAERRCIVDLKTECGDQFILKLEAMLRDMVKSRDIMQQFNNAYDAELEHCPELAVQVLATGSWPTQPTACCNLPAELQPLCDKFQSYYTSAHPRQKLSWKTNLGNADLCADFGKGKKHELNVSTYQMCILMLFNAADRLSYKQIELETGIPPSDLRSCLQSLACVEGKNPLWKEPLSKEIGEDDLFVVNEEFAGRLSTEAAQQASEAEKRESRQILDESRNPSIDLAIVQIMKAKRELHNSFLIAEVKNRLQSRFPVNNLKIKRRIEHLIDREYLERDSKRRAFFLYLE